MPTAESAKGAGTRLPENCQPPKTQSTQRNLLLIDHLDTHKPQDARQLNGVSKPASEA
jgi:hypothetical protein